MSLVAPFWGSYRKVSLSCRLAEGAQAAPYLVEGAAGTVPASLHFLSLWRGDGQGPAPQVPRRGDRRLLCWGGQGSGLLAVPSALHVAKANVLRGAAVTLALHSPCAAGPVSM